MSDDKHHIREQSEIKILIHNADEQTIKNAELVLSNTKKRLAAEIGWLPGLEPKRVSQAISILVTNPVKLRHLTHLPHLARANLLAAGLVHVIRQLTTYGLAQWIIEIAYEYDNIDNQQIISELNKERSIAQFLKISDASLVSMELMHRGQFYTNVIVNALDELPSHSLVEVVTIMVDESTKNGTTHAPRLIDKVVANFESKVQSFLEKEKSTINKLIQHIRNAVENDKGDDYIMGLVSKLEKVAKNWDRVAQPIQVSKRSTGTTHDMSHSVANDIRSLAIDMHNEHGRLDISKRLTTLQKEIFAEVDRLLDLIIEDEAKLNEIARERSRILAEMKAHAESWKKEITYECEIGALSKQKLRISPDGVQWKGKKIPLDDIRKVRWGATSYSVSEIPMGTKFNIFVGGSTDFLDIEIRKQDIFVEFVDRLWKTAGVRLLTEMLEELRVGRKCKFETAAVVDNGVEMERRKIIGANEKVFCKWADVIAGSGDGMFYMVKKNDKKVKVELSYLWSDNVHILEAAVRALLKSSKNKLSDLLNETN